MAFCTTCGSQAADGAKFCSSCGSSLPAPPAIRSKPVYAAPVLPPGAPAALMPVPAPYYGPMPSEKSSLLALILSFLIPGLGQLCNGETSKGVVFLVVGSVLWILTVITFFLRVAAIPLWIYRMYDPYTRAQVYNQALRMSGRAPW